MAPKKTTTDVDENVSVQVTPEGWEFETVVEESGIKVVFDTIGEAFLGQYVGPEDIQPPNGEDPFTLYHFRGFDGQLYSVNESYKLKAARDLLTHGDWVRLTYTKDIPSSKGNPMKDIKVEVRKA